MADPSRLAIVTGGAGGERGLGLTTTEALARTGAAVVVWDRDGAANASARRELESSGLSAEFREVDVTDVTEVARAYEAARAEYGAAAVLVNNAAVKMAGVIGPKEERTRPSVPFWELDVAAVRRLLDVNVVGPLLTASVVAPDMVRAGRGSIVNVITSAHTQRNATHIPYGPSKAALEALSAAMAEQLAGTGVRVNAVLPGGSANRRGEFRDDKTPYDTMVAPILYLASDESSGVTGQVIAGTDFGRGRPATRPATTDAKEERRAG